MTHERIQDTIDALDDLLEAERLAVLAGDLDGISRALDRKAQLIDQLNQKDVADREVLDTLNAKVERNQLLLNSALDGIRSVARRLATMRRIRGSLDTYGADGKKSSIEIGTDRSVEKRA